MVKEQLFKSVNEKLGESREEFEANFNTITEQTKKSHPNLDAGKLELQIIKVVRGYYLSKLRLPGRDLIGYVIGYTDVKDTNDYTLSAAKKAFDSKKIDEFNNNEKNRKDKLVLLPSGKVMKTVIAKKGNSQGQEFEFELEPKIQRNVYGFVKMPETNEMKRFVAYQVFDIPNFTHFDKDQKEFELAKLPKPSATGKQAVRFRGIIDTISESGIVTIKTTPQTEFKAIVGKTDMLAYEDLLGKFFKATDLKKLDNITNKTEISVYGEVAYSQGSDYGDKLFMQLDPNDISLDENAEELMVQLPSDIKLAEVEGYSNGCNVCAFGSYQIYDDKKTGRNVRKLAAYGVYVLDKDKVVQTEQTSLSSVWNK